MKLTRLVLLWCLIGCSGSPAPLTFANGAPEGTPAHAGQVLFLTSAWGVEQLGSWPPAAFMLKLMDDEPEVFGDQYAKFGFTPDPADEFPVGFKRGSVDRERVSETCALCHVSALPDGSLWLGLPAARLDFSRFRLEVDQRWVAAGNPSMLSDGVRAKLPAYGPGRTAADSDSYRRAIPADFPPYFRLGQRTAMNYLGTGQNLRTETYFSLHAFGAGAPNREEARVPLPDQASIDTFLSFFGALEPPPAPPTSAALVARGQAVFQSAGCGGCHHVGELALDGVVTLDTSTAARERLPGEDPRFPRGSITTSRAHRVLQDGDPEDPSTSDMERIGDYLELILENGLAVRQTDGYRVSGLFGLAYTAPYLHNGSVPTLEDLLKKAADRPTRWRRGEFEVDTTQPGNDNRGHEFGSELPAAGKAALVEYLKSLGG